MLRLAACLSALAGPALAEGVVTARYEDPTTRYAHGVLGDAVEWGALFMEGSSGKAVRVRLPQSRVFEDTGPRLFDVDGDGDNEVIVVETDIGRGARLSIYDTEGLVAANDFIGQTNRWLAPLGVGAADLDGDGVVEFAYVDRPHLAKRLLILRRDGRELRLVAALDGVSNHRIGDSDIAGGIRDCGAGPEMIVATADWSDVVAVRFDGLSFASRVLATHQGRQTFAAAMDCKI